MREFPAAEARWLRRPARTGRVHGDFGIAPIGAGAREGLTPDRVADIAFAIASPDTLRALTDRCGWPLSEAQELIVRALESELRHNRRRPVR